MNPVAVATMLGIALGFFGLLAYALTVGEAWLLAVLAIVAIGVFVRWGEEALPPSMRGPEAVTRSRRHVSSSAGPRVASGPCPVPASGPTVTG